MDYYFYACVAWIGDVETQINRVQKKIPLVIGLGVTGQSLVNYLSLSHKEIFLIEEWKENPYLREINQEYFKVNLNPKINDELLKKVSEIYASPGIPSHHDIFSYAFKHKVNISSDIQLFIENNRSKKILVTGTNGKTSTSLILTSLFQSYFPNLKIATLGNIGEPVLSYINEDIDLSIIEVSSFQLELLGNIEFDIGLLLNIEQDHLDRHQNFEDYKDIKYSILKKSNHNISFDESNPFSKDFINYKDFNLPEELSDSKIFEYWPSHDKENLKAAIATLHTYIHHFTNLSLENFISYSELEKAFKDFTKPPHRFEFVGKVNGVNYVNDSKATNIDATLKALSAISEMAEEADIYLICGGDLKEQDITSPNLDIIRRVKKAFIYGKDKESINKSISRYTKSKCILDLDEAVKNSKKLSKKGDYVILSPACSSLDMFKDYKERGDKFKRLIQQLSYE